MPPGLYNLAGSAVTAISNLLATRFTNRSNRRIAYSANALQARLADLGYERSLPANQVRNLMNAGMSKAGALQTLDNGGSYTAPAVSTAQMQSPQIPDFGAAIASDMQYQLRNEELQQQRDMFEHQKELDTQEQLRKQEEHIEKMREMRYGNDTKKAIDDLQADFESKLADGNLDIMSIRTDKDLHEIMKDSESWRYAPQAARDVFYKDLERRRLQLKEEQDREIASAVEESRKLLSSANLRTALSQATISEEDAKRYPEIADIRKYLLNGELQQKLLDIQFNQDTYETRKKALELENLLKSYQAAIEKANVKFASTDFAHRNKYVSTIIDEVQPIINTIMQALYLFNRGHK